MRGGDDHFYTRMIPETLVSLPDEMTERACGQVQPVARVDLPVLGMGLALPPMLPGCSHGTMSAFHPRNHDSCVTFS